jgi:alpha-galactosidase
MTYCNGDDNDSCKLWRRLFISRFLPNRRNGKKSFKPPISINFWGGLPQEKIINQLRIFQKAKVKPDLVWFDAGWNGSSPLKENGNPLYPWYKELGDWQIHPVLFKDGSFKEVSSVIHEMGARFLLWGQIEEARGFVLDRLTFGRESYYSYENTMRSEWAGDAIPIYTLRFSDDKVVDKLIDFFKMMHKENGMDCVRMDSFDEPYFAIRHNDFELSRRIDPANDRLREGYTENKHVTGLYRLWDSLYRELPDFFLDNTCSGGMRMDIELCSRGITLWRTDYSHGQDRESVQTHTQNLARWIPLQCVGVLELKDEYGYRSLYSGVAGFGGMIPTEDDTDLIKKVYDEFDTLQPYWLGDYYQLLPARYDKKSWQAYELYREDMEEGAVIAVRRELSEEESRNVKLCGLEKDGVYEIRELLSKEPMMTKKGIELSEEGITLSLDQRKIAAYTVKRIK